MSTTSNDSCYLVLCTCPNTEVSESIAKTLVNDQLAACVNILPTIHSIYRWKGRTHSENECLLIIKTSKISYKKAESAIRLLHPYEIPEIIALPIEQGSQSYLDWVIQQSTGENSCA